MPPRDVAALSDTTRVLRLRSTVPRSDRPEGFTGDLCFTSEMVAAFVHAYTDPGDLVVDPFAGFGTTLATAQRLGRAAVGFEIDAARVAQARKALTDPSSLRHQDVRRFDWRTLPQFTLAITSPPYMTRDDHAQNPLSGYQTLDGDYARYLRDLQEICCGMATRAAGPDARIVLNVANLPSTPLAWDVGAALSEVLEFEREVVLDWDDPQDWFTQDYCLIFRPRAADGLTDPAASGTVSGAPATTAARPS
ncbi:DNA methyltransferase [Desertihabitans aurantiacus]|uniref:DNA methyltransferase n=1 Tax=Desertihabitans aurantiacus TaxID=2282477 RepID=UPI000DF7B6CD|nr:DNA methyltransferase [Desertihabitans aurantiacus]